MKNFDDVIIHVKQNSLSKTEINFLVIYCRILKTRNPHNSQLLRIFLRVIRKLYKVSFGKNFCELYEFL